MKRTLSLLLASLVAVNLCLAEERAFSDVKLADAKGKQADARLIFSDINQNLVVRVADHDFVTVPYNRLDNFSYEYTKKHRVTQARIRWWLRWEPARLSC